MKRAGLRRLGRWCANPTREYGAVAGLFLIALVVVKAIELVGLVRRMEVDNSLNLLIRAVTYSLTIVSWVVLAAWPLHLLQHRVSPKASRIVTPLFFALWLLVEEGLILYNAHNGFLLSGGELLARPIRESWLAVVSVAGPVWPVAGVVLWLTLFVFAARWLMTRQRRVGRVPLLVTGVMLLLSLLLHPEHLRIDRYDTYIVNKTHCICTSLVDYWKSTGGSIISPRREAVPEFDEAMTDAFLSIHPDLHPADKHYPLERPDATPDNLSPYFNSAERPPHVVMVVVESMGEECLRTGIMPFLDSLSHHSLYWPNCLSTTPRSYGVVPALTGSVGGPCGFQFGRMPEHNSMFSILRHAGYHTGAYYAGFFAFDAVYDYLHAQHIDYLSPFFDEYGQREDKEKVGNYWGYHDDLLLARTVEEMGRRPREPRFDLVVTLTMHESLDLADKKRQADYLGRVRRHARNLPAGERGWVERQELFCAAALFADDALRQFFGQYLQLPGAENTIFVVTGDHASGKIGDTPLSSHHVPLLIWSPLLNEVHQFPVIVTHNDVAPSLCRLLGSKYGVPMPETVHWLGSGLPTSDSDGCDRRMLIVNYAHEMHEMLCGGYFYREASTGTQERLYAVGPGLAMREVHDPEACRRCRAELKTYQYIYKYTYQADRLTNHPLYRPYRYAIYRRVSIPEAFSVTAPDRHPGGPRYEEREILPYTEMKEDTGSFKVVRLTIAADVSVNKSVGIDAYPSFYITGWSDGNIWECVNPLKYIQSDEVEPDSIYHITIEKEYPMAKQGATHLRAVLISPMNDFGWEPGVGVTLYNTNVLLEYGK